MLSATPFAALHEKAVFRRMTAEFVKPDVPFYSETTNAAEYVPKVLAKTNSDRFAIN